MREIIALIVLLAGTSLLEIPELRAGADYETDYSFIFGLVITCGALLYLALALAERFSGKMKKWHRITPGNPTEFDEEEWKRLEQPPVPRPTRPPERQLRDAHRPPMNYARRPAPAAEEWEEPPEEKPPAMFYDPGFDETAGKAAPEPEGKDEFDEIFGDKDK